MRRLVLAAPALLALTVLTGAGGGKGDARRGEIAFRKCYACHALEPGKHDLSGPSLHRIVSGRIAAAPGYDYSPALKALARRRPRWDEPLLDRFIADPERVAPRTSMTFTGMRDRRERADLIAYLRRAGRR